MTKKLFFILMGMFVLSGHHRVFSMEERGEEFGVNPCKRTADYRDENDGAAQNKRVCVTLEDTWQFLPLTPEDTRQFLPETLLSVNAKADLMVASRFFEHGDKEQKNLGFSSLMALAKRVDLPDNLCTHNIRKDVARLIFQKGALEQKARVFSEGGQNLYKALDAILMTSVFAEQEKICNDLITIIQSSLLSEIDHRMKAKKLIFSFGTPDQKEFGFSELAALASYESAYVRGNAAYIIFNFGTLDQKEHALSIVGIQNLYQPLLSVLKTSHVGKEKMCLDFTRILQNDQLSPICQMRAGSLVLAYGTKEQKKEAFSDLMAFAINEDLTENIRRDAAGFIFSEGNSEQKAAAFSVGGQNLYAALYGLTMLPKDKEKVSSYLREILQSSKISGIDRTRAETLISEFKPEVKGL